MTHDHRAEFVVGETELGADRRLSLRALCQRLQDAAAEDAARLGIGVAELSQHGLAWMLVRLEVHVRAAPAAGQRMRLRTWPRGRGRLLAERDFELTGDAGQVLALATSRWVVADLSLRRAVRLPDFIRAVPTSPHPALLDEAPPLRSLGDCDGERRFDVSAADLDGAGHVNNTRYVGWTVESLPEELQRSSRPCELAIEFAREAVAGDSVLVRTGRDADDASLWRHELLRAGGERLALAATRWVPRGP